MPSRAGWAQHWSRIEGQSAQFETQKAETRREQSERNLTYQEQNLGTAAQVAGTLGGESADISPYLGRYALNEAGAKQIGGGAWDSLKGFSGDLQIANDFMQQAEDAARAGDTAGAAKFRAQAEAATTANIGNIHVPDASNISALFSFTEDPIDQAKSRLGSPMARTVGGLVKQGREFLDPESETSRRYKRSLTEGADRAITSASREALRQQRDMSLSFGAGRSLGRERDFAQRTQDAFATQRAQVHTQAAAQFESFSRAFAADSTKLGQAWLQNQGGIREQFQGAMDNLANIQSGAKMQMASLETSYSAVSAQVSAARSDSKRQFWSSVIGSYTDLIKPTG